MPTSVAIIRSVLVRTGLVLAAVLFTSTAGEAQGDLDLNDVVDTLTLHLDLTGDQPSQLEGLLVTFATDWNAVQEKYEDAEDKDGMIDELKAVQAMYQDGLAAVLSEQQFEAYNQLIDQVMHEIFSEVAELKLRDLQPALELSEDQLMQLKPVMGTALVDVVKLMWDNAGKRMGIRRKLQLANAVKKIQSTAKTQTNEILTPEQIATWEAMKEAAKEEE
jgi:hypothetical protein